MRQDGRHTRSGNNAWKIKVVPLRLRDILRKSGHLEDVKFKFEYVPNDKLN